MPAVGPDYKTLGLFGRYNYERTDGKPLDEGEQLFALRFDKNDAWGATCRATLKEFCDKLDKIGYQPLAQDLRARVAAVEERIKASNPPAAPPPPAFDVPPEL